MWDYPQATEGFWGAALSWLLQNLLWDLLGGLIFKKTFVLQNSQQVWGLNATASYWKAKRSYRDAMAISLGCFTAVRDNHDGTPQFRTIR